MKKIITSILALSFFLTPALAAAQNLTDPGAARRAELEQVAAAKAAIEQKRFETAKAKAKEEIARRIEKMQQVIGRIQGMKRVSQRDQELLTRELNSQIADMRALNQKIQNETSSTTLRADIASITKSYRIFALVVPRTTIIAAADRIFTIAEDLRLVSAKLAVQIDSLPITDVNHRVPLLSLRAKLDAKIRMSGSTASSTQSAPDKAQAAIDLVTHLVPDNGATSTMQANTAALQSARNYIQSAQQDLVSANQIAKQIVAGLKAAGIKTKTTNK